MLITDLQNAVHDIQRKESNGRFFYDKLIFNVAYRSGNSSQLTHSCVCNFVSSQLF